MCVCVRVCERARVRVRACVCVCMSGGWGREKGGYIGRHIPLLRIGEVDGWVTKVFRWLYHGRKIALPRSVGGYIQ